MARALLSEREPEAASGRDRLSHPSLPSDRSLVRRLRRGCNEAATQIYLRYAKRLLALVHSRCSSDLAARFDADDVVQSVFRSFFQAARRGLYDVPAGEELWQILLVIALNKLRNAAAFHRAARRDVRHTIAGFPGKTLSQLAEDDFAEVFLQLAVGEALERLPAAHRHMVELRLQGHAVAEIARLTRRSKRTTERLLQEARKELHALFHEGP
jgi:RNA polymerase sigma-70 factor (ECF subfamily)